jgi:hypothetical protein
LRSAGTDELNLSPEKKHPLLVKQRMFFALAAVGCVTTGLPFAAQRR